jgi:preprotein translocase subunit YajC
MNTILVGTDSNGVSIEKGDHVVADDGSHGKITAVWDDGTVEVHHANSHQGPVVDTFDIKGHHIIKIEDWE